MTATSYVLLAIVLGLTAALVATRRRIDTSTTAVESPSATDETDAIAPVRLEAAAALAPLAIVVLNEAGDRVFENNAAAAYTAATGDAAVVGLRLRNLFTEAVGFDESIEQEIELFSPASRTVLLQAHPLFRDAERIGTVAFIEDLTTRSQIDSIRSDFIANASHELKTPLGAMRLLAEAMVTSDNPAVIQDLAAKVHSEAGRMTRLVEDILDLALIEEARPPAETLALDDVIADAVAKSQMLADTMGIPVTSECPQLSLRGDRRSLVSALANLVENAINYTAAKGTDPPEAVHVRARREGDRAVIEVEDHGIGIPERHQERIFERFYRVDRGRSRSRGGTGLGLAIVRHVVLNHRGELSVESVPGEGSKFRLELPLLES